GIRDFHVTGVQTCALPIYGVADSTVFGGIAGDSMAAFLSKGAAFRDPDGAAIDQGIARAEQAFAGNSGNLSDLRERLLRTMWDQIGRASCRERVGMARVAG